MKKIRELFRNTKLNIKFTSIIILFMVIPIGVLAGVLFYVMEQNAVQENMDYMEYTMQRNEDGIKTKIDSINMSTQFFFPASNVECICDWGRNLYGRLAGF